MRNRKTFLTSMAAAAAVLVQVTSKPPRRRRFTAFARIAPGALTALLFGVIDYGRSARPKVRRLRISAIEVLTDLRRQQRPAHPLANPRFLFLHEPDFLTSAVIAIRTACDDPFNFNLPPAARRVIARIRASASWAFGLPAKQPRAMVRERLSRYQASSGFPAATATSDRSHQTANVWIYVDKPASLPGLPQRLSPSVS